MLLVYKREKYDIQEESKICKGYNKEELNYIKREKRKTFYFEKPRLTFLFHKC